MKKTLNDIWGLLKGMGITFKYYFFRPVTVQYPKESVKISPRWRGTLRQLYDDKGVEICDGCQICAKVCPVNCISMEVYKEENTGKRKTSKYTINFGRCMYCGLCVESCPKKCLVHTPDFEFCTYDRETLILEKDKLLR
ncbi:MAG: NADH-quinone oxidoreductase subunit I [Candidatus Firestonebacteria bacterium]